MDYLKVYNVSYNINAYVFLLVVLVRDVVHYQLDATKKLQRPLSLD